jgi:hypothetical protein
MFSYRPTVTAAVDRWVSNIGGMIILRGKLNYMLQCQFVCHKSHVDYLGVGPGLPRMKTDN